MSKRKFDSPDPKCKEGRLPKAPRKENENPDPNTDLSNDFYSAISFSPVIHGTLDFSEEETSSSSSSNQNTSGPRTYTFDTNRPGWEDAMADMINYAISRGQTVSFGLVENGFQTLIIYPTDTQTTTPPSLHYTLIQDDSTDETAESYIMEEAPQHEVNVIPYEEDSSIEQDPGRGSSSPSSIISGLTNDEDNSVSTQQTHPQRLDFGPIFQSPTPTLQNLTTPPIPQGNENFYFQNNANSSSASANIFFDNEDPLEEQLNTLFDSSLLLGEFINGAGLSFVSLLYFIFEDIPQIS